MRRDFDVVIAGGGLAGGAAPAQGGPPAAPAALRIAVLEPVRPERLAGGEPLDLRVSMLSRSSQRLLERSGAWSAVAARGAAACQRMVVWDERGSPQGTGALSFDAADCGEPDLGHVVENRAVQAALLDCAEAAGVVVLGAGLAALAPSPAAIGVTTSDGRRLEAALLVGADGSGSVARQLAGIATREHDYRQQAIVAHLGCEHRHRDTAWQRFLAGGPLALLPLADGRVSLVWSTASDEAAALVAIDDAEFSRRVTAASAGVLGRLEVTTARGVFPLRLRQATRHAGARIVLVGDAAQAVHPLAGQGVNLGFQDVAALTEVLGAALSAGNDPGDPSVLRRYERWRRAATGPMIRALDGIQRLFAGSDPLQSWLRRRGLDLVDATPGAKRLLVRHALGLAGEVPRSFQPVRGG